MQRQYKRTDRISDMLQREIAQMIQREVKDPRLGKLITVSGVEISRDLSYAKIYITQMDTEKKSVQDTLKILNHAAGYLRSQLGQRIKLRVTPQLKFIYDESISRGAHLSHLINTAVASDSSETSDDSEVNPMDDET